MEIAILGARGSWHSERLAAAGRRLGHAVAIVEYRQLTAWLGGPTPTLRASRRLDLEKVDRVLVRSIPPGSLEQVVFRMDALHALRLVGVPVLNPPAAIEACVDKYLATARLSAVGLPTPRTAICEDLDEALEAFAALGGDVVVKSLFGSEGRGMTRVADEATAYRVFFALTRAQSALYLQEFISQPGGDLRAFVLGDRVLASMRRWSPSDFRANVSLGGQFEAYSLSAAEEELAIRAARAVGALVAGVDLLPDARGGTTVLEVNSAPGFQAIQQTTDVDIASEIMRFLTAANW